MCCTVCQSFMLLVNGILNETIFCTLADIDECWNSCPCPSGKECVNSLGSYECEGRALQVNLNKRPEYKI